MKVSKDEVALRDTRSRSLFLDSGAHSLYNREADNGNRRTDAASLAEKYRFFDLTKGSDFRKFVEDYAAFLRKHPEVDLYVTLDAIYNPQRTWDITKCLKEEYGLNPVPVVHCHAELKWIARYVEQGHKLIGIGGLGQGITKQAFLGWGDRVFHFLCPAPDKLPVVRTHGFAMTSWELLLRYPWWSVDSASWLKAAAFGQIYVPHCRGGEFVFTEPPYSISVSHESPNRKEKGKHILNLPQDTRKITCAWLEQIGVPLGVKLEDGTVKEWGVVSHLEARAKANLLYFRRLADHLVFPRRFMRTPGTGFGLVSSTKGEASLPELKPYRRERPMRIYFSGLSGGGVYPEVLIKEENPDLMLSFDNLREASEKSTGWRRFRAHTRHLQSI